MRKLNYNYYVIGNKIVCTTKMGEHKFRATATCSSEDEFNEEIGKTLAKARVDVKVEEYRLKQAKNNVELSGKSVERANWYFNKKYNKYNQVSADYKQSLENLKAIMNKTF